MKRPWDIPCPQCRVGIKRKKFSQHLTLCAAESFNTQLINNEEVNMSGSLDASLSDSESSSSSSSSSKSSSSSSSEKSFSTLSDSDSSEEGEGHEVELLQSRYKFLEHPALIRFFAKLNDDDLDRLVGCYLQGSPLHETKAIKRSETLCGHEVSTQECEGNSLIKTKQSFQRMLAKITRISDSRRFTAGPLRGVTADSSLTFRPFMSLISTLLNDREWLGSGFIAKAPINVGANTAYASFSQGETFRRWHAKIKAQYPNTDFLPLPFSMWSDGAEFMSRGGSAHVLMASMLTASPGQLNNKAKGTRLIGFMGDMVVSKKTQSKINSLLKAQLQARTLATIISELLTVKDGVMMSVLGKQMLVIPAIMYISGDLVESRVTTPSRHCPFCIQGNDGKNIPIQLMRNRFTNDELDDVKMVEREQSIGITDGHEQLYKMFPGNIKPVQSFREILWLQNDESPPNVPDTLHVIALGECKRLLNLIKLNIDIHETLTGFKKILKKPETGADFYRAMALLPVILQEHSERVPNAIIIREAVDALCHLVKGAGADILTFEDMTNINDACNVLELILPQLYFKTNDITHVLTQHQFHQHTLSEFGCPKGFGAARYEASITLLKRSLNRASNRRPDWTTSLVQKATYGETVRSFQGKGNPDPFAPPVFCKVVFATMSKKKFNVGFIDVAREGANAKPRRVKLQVHGRMSKSRYSVLQLTGKRIGSILEFDISYNGQALKLGESVFIKNAQAKVLVQIWEVKTFKNVPAADMPDPGIWKVMGKAQQEPIWVELDEIEGGCFHLDSVDDKAWVADMHLSSFIGNSPSLIATPDRRFE